MIAGLEDITHGELFIDGDLANDTAPKDRNIAMVFQNYALYPHMSVFDNMAFSLKLRKVAVPVLDKDGKEIPEIDKAKIEELNDLIGRYYQEGNREDDIKKLQEQIDYLYKNPTAIRCVYRHYTKKEIQDKVNHAATILGLTQYLKRKPKELSGGQRQRVALGRAIVRNPKVFLMDEPLSNLDAKLRAQMRSEIIKIHRRVGATTIYVTHDQTEAMAMADRIVIMEGGVVQQIGTPKELYNEPANIFVASFIGSPSMNMFNGTIEDSCFVFENTDIKIKLPQKYAESTKAYEKKAIKLGIRPEDIYVNSKDTNNTNSSVPIPVSIDLHELLGADYIVYGFVNDQRVIFTAPTRYKITDNTKIHIYFNLDKIHLFDADTTKRVK